MIRRIFYSYLLSIFLCLNLSAFNPIDCAKLFFESEDLDFEQKVILGAAKTVGLFQPITSEFRASLEQAHNDQVAFNFKKPPKLKVRALKAHDLSYTIDNDDATRVQKTIEDLRYFQQVNSTHNIDTLPSDISGVLRGFGYTEGFGRTYLITSVGGAWSRGGHLLKALVPLNLEALTSNEEKKILIVADLILKASSDLEALAHLLSNEELFSRELIAILFNKSQEALNTLQIVKEFIDLAGGSEKIRKMKQKDIDKLTSTITKKAGITPKDFHNLALNAKEQMIETVIKPIIYGAKDSPVAINIIDLKLMVAAVLSAVTKSYYIFDFWTAPNNHDAIRSYIREFKYTHLSKRFSRNEIIDRKIHDAISNYLRASELLHESFLLGYMEIVPPIDRIQTNLLGHVVWQDDKEKAIHNSPGVASIIEYIQKTARAQQLKLRGIDTLLFNNVEVLGGIPREITGYRKIRETNPDVNSTFVFVKTQEGYEGGFAVVCLDDGRILLLEQSQVPEDLANSYSYFNTNTLIIDLDASPSKEIGFEIKENNAVTRVKMNLGDISHVNQTKIILGSITSNYLNFKNYGNYLTNGRSLLEEVDSWVSTLIDSTLK